MPHWSPSTINIRRNSTLSEIEIFSYEKGGWAKQLHKVKNKDWLFSRKICQNKVKMDTKGQQACVSSVWYLFKCIKTNIYLCF